MTRSILFFGSMTWPPRSSRSYAGCCATSGSARKARIVVRITRASYTGKSAHGDLRAYRIRTRERGGARGLRRHHDNAPRKACEQFLEGARARSGAAAAYLGEREVCHGCGWCDRSVDEGDDLCRGERDEPVPLLHRVTYRRRE